MTLKKHNPGCNCCGCLIIEDDFTSDPYAANFTEVGSQTWNSGNTTVEVSGTAPSLGITTATAGSVVQAASAVASNLVTNDWNAVVICYEDVNNLLFAEGRVTSTSLEVRVGHRAGGTNTVLQTVTVALVSGSHTGMTLAVCYDGTYLRGYAETNAGKVASVSSPHSYSGSGNKGGFGYVRAPSADQEFNSFKFGKYASGCNYCVPVCSFCIDDKMANGFVVEVPALGNGSGGFACSACASEAATYVADDSVIESQNFSVVSCAVGLFVSPTECGLTRINVYLGNQMIRVSLCFNVTSGGCVMDSSGGTVVPTDQIIQYEKSYDGDIDCLNLVDEEIPFAQHVGSRVHCDGTGTSVRLTSITAP